MLLIEAQRRAAAVLARHLPEAAAPVVLNARNPDQESHVFRAALAPQGSVIVKVAAPGRLAAQFDRLSAVHPQMQDGLYRVPRPILHDAALGVMLMEDAWGRSGESLWQEGPSGIARVLAAAGGWLGRYHRLSAAEAGFNPDPHLNWLSKLLDSPRPPDQPIPARPALEAHLPGLQAMADQARNQPVLRCITHRDFHLGNLLVRKHGRTYGIDMENTRRDEGLRDLLHLLCDAARLAADPAEALAAGPALRRAYGRSPAAEPVRRFFQAAVALTLWAGLSGRQGALAPRAAQRLLLAQRLLESGDILRLLPENGTEPANPPQAD